VKDYKIGTLIGQPTQGTLICGVPIRLDVDFSLSLGTMYGYSPSNKPLLNAPIKPDIVVEPDLNNIGTDYILQKAIEHLKNN
jgi:C-terminal processing protease CtpA/Prc